MRKNRSSVLQIGHLQFGSKVCEMRIVLTGGFGAGAGGLSAALGDVVAVSREAEDVVDGVPRSLVGAAGAGPGSGLVERVALEQAGGVLAGSALHAMCSLTTASTLTAVFTAWHWAASSLTRCSFAGGGASGRGSPAGQSQPQHGVGCCASGDCTNRLTPNNANL